MKPFRLLRDEMLLRRETRAKGNGAVNLNLDLPYRLRLEDEVKFLNRQEIEEIKNRVRATVDLMPQGPQGVSKDQVIETANRIQIEQIAALGPFAKRVSATLLTLSVRLRYDGVPPRMGPDGTRPGVWWGELRAQLEEYPSHLAVSDTVAKWLVETWFDEKAQNGLDDNLQTWANVFEAEMERLKKEIGA